MTNHLEFYETEAGVVKALLEYYPIHPSDSVFEPCAGDLAIARFFPGCLTNDIDEARSTDLHLDAARPETWASIPKRNWVVTNPPFSKAHLILPLAFDWALDGVAFLLRLTFLEPCNNRGEWLEAHESHLAGIFPFNPRPSFTADGNTDKATVAWMIFTKRPVEGAWVRFVTNWRES